MNGATIGHTNGHTNGHKCTHLHEPHNVEASFHYLAATCSPEELSNKPGLANPNTYGDVNDARHLMVHDVSGHENEYNLDEHGFAYVNHATAMENDGWADDDLVRDRYYKETEELIKKVTGGSTVHVFNHLIRQSDGKSPRERGPRERVHHQAYKVHVDQSWKQVIQHVHDAYGEEEGSKLMKKRLLILNVWRPIRQVFRDPFGITDINSQEHSDLVRLDMVLQGGIKTSVLAVRYNPKHAWHFKYGQRPDEPLLFKQFDSGDRRMLGQVLHSAFVDEAEADNYPRHSIEVRALVFYDDQEGIDPHTAPALR